MLQFISPLETIIFSSELKEFKFASDSDVMMTFTIDDKTAYSQSYVPTSEGIITVFALDEIFKVQKTSSLGKCIISITNEYDEKIEYSFYCIQCSASLDVTATEFLDNYFLISSCSDSKNTAYGRPERFWILHTSGTRNLHRKCYYINSDNVISVETYTYPFTVNEYELKAIEFNSNEFDVSGKTLFKIEFYDEFRLLSYDVDIRKDIDSFLFEYENVFGLMDTITYFGLKESEQKATYESGQLNGRLINSNIQCYTETKVHSGYISQKDIYPYISFITSPKIFLSDDSMLRGVILTDQETAYSNDLSEMIDFTVTFRYERDMMIIKAKDNRIFDDTFDFTFN